MVRLFALLLGIAFGGAVMYVGFQYHTVRTADRILLVPKLQTALDEFYVDIRDWGYKEWKDHPTLARAMVSAGHGEIVESSVKSGILENFFSRIRGPSWLEGKARKPQPQ